MFHADCEGLDAGEKATVKANIGEQVAVCTRCILMADSVWRTASYDTIRVAATLTKAMRDGATGKEKLSATCREVTPPIDAKSVRDLVSTWKHGGSVSAGKGTRTLLDKLTAQILQDRAPELDHLDEDLVSMLREHRRKESSPSPRRVEASKAAACPPTRQKAGASVVDIGSLSIPSRKRKLKLGVASSSCDAASMCG